MFQQNSLTNKQHIVQPAEAVCHPTNLVERPADAVDPLYLQARQLVPLLSVHQRRRLRLEQCPLLVALVEELGHHEVSGLWAG